jgi:hypothetical protein
MGEQLLFLLFILFSVVSALLERRKRKRAREEAQRKEAGKPERAEGDTDEEVAEEEQEAWPFPMGGDPFGLPQQRRSATGRPASDSESDLEVVEEALPPGRERKPGLLERLTREAREIEQQARLVEAQAKESARQIQQVQPRRRIQEAVREEIARVQAKPRTTAKKKRWQVTAASARDAIVYAEILGPPKAERKEEGSFS